MNKKAKETISKLIEDNINYIKNGNLEKELKNNKNFLIDYEFQITLNNSLLLEKIQKQFREISPFVFKLKESIDDITDKNILNSIYLLSSSIISTLESMIILIKYNKYSPIMILSRNVEEALQQIQLFTFEFKDNENKKLKEWFKGEIVSHGEGRKKVSNSVDGKGIDLGRMSSYVYQITSQFAHNGYISILENISPFTKDIDYSGLTEKYRMYGGMGQILRNIEKFMVSLKGIYFFILKDLETYDKIDKILLKNNPNINSINNFDNIKKQFPEK